jgi:hypothetical protein
MCEFGLKICLSSALDDKEILISYFHLKRELNLLGPSEYVGLSYSASMTESCLTKTATL